MINQPHIIVLLSDQHRGQAMAHLGDPNLRTPAMDRMAAEGASFATAFANCPVCVPSRGTMLSGRHAHAGPVQGFNDVWKPAAPGLISELKRAGYRTAFFGKWHLGVSRDQLHPDLRRPESQVPRMLRTPEHFRAGFDDWCAYENGGPMFRPTVYRDGAELPEVHDGYDADVLTDLALRYLDEYGREQPLFLVVSVLPPHFPLVVPERWRRFDPQTLRVAPNFTEAPGMREALASYCAMVEDVDWNLGRIRERIAALPRFADRTVTAYLSDHGEFIGSHGRQSRKEHPHEESVRIPAIFAGPGVVARGVVPGLFSMIDWAPTVLGLAGLPVPGWMQGQDWSSGLRGLPCAGPDDVLLEMCGAPRHALDFRDWRAIRTADRMYAVYEDGSEQLYDLAADPWQLRDRSADWPEERARLRALLLRRLAETREPYFDVLIEHGVASLEPVDVSGREDGWQNYPHPGATMQAPGLDRRRSNT